MRNLKKIALCVMVTAVIGVIACDSVFAGPILPPNIIVKSK